MPVNGDGHGNYLSISGENCTLKKIRGVKILEDHNGRDLLKILTSLDGSGALAASNPNTDAALVNINAAITNLLARLDTVEKYLQTLPPPGKPLKGDAGEPGQPGEPGPQGPRGKDGASTFAALKDVNLDGLDDGAIMVYSAKEKKWVVSLEESD